MKVRLLSRAHFSAAHRLHSEALDPAANRWVFDRCNNPAGHGHTYELEVAVQGEVDPGTGLVMNILDLKRVIEDCVLRPMDRRHLNHDVPFLSGVNPTAENISAAIWLQLEGRVAPARLARVTLNETDKNRVVYEGAKQ
ncbi:MAG: 6-carboxytetrahydropterin synthase [Thermoanaerobaculia bacterium]